jgi:S1-C subfamily serine protease
MQRRFLGSWCALAALLWALSLVSAAPADDREAAKSLLAATVTVEVESTSDAATSTGDDSTAKSDSSARSVLAVASGTIVAPEGLIVVTQIPHGENAEYYVRPGAGERLPARVVVSDRRSGLRLLQADAIRSLPHLKLALEPVEVGQRVLAAVVYQGRPVRYVRPHPPHHLSAGIVAAAGRRAEGFAVELFQTDVRAGAGSAGAPLVDENGRLVGVLVAADESQPQNEVTLAIPAHYVGELLKVRTGEETVVIHPAYLGVQLEPAEDGAGAKVTQVFDDSPAAKAGVEAGDIVTAFNGEEVQSPEDLTALVGRLKSGAEATVKLKRGDEQPELAVVLGERPQTDSASPQEYSLELSLPGQYRVLPLGTGGGTSSADQQTLNALSALLQQRQRQATQRLGIINLKNSEIRNEELTPLTVYVQRPQADERLDRLTEEVKTLSEEVKKLSEQLQAISKKLEKPGQMTREEAIESLREEFLEKLDDLVRQKNANPR